MYFGSRHGGGFQYGIGTEVALNTEKFVLGPKICGFIYYQFIVFGSVLLIYTDFENYTLRYVPVFGIGAAFFKLTINPNIIITNKKYRPVNNGLISVSVNVVLDKY